MRRYTVAELEAMEAGELRAVLDLLADLPEDRHGELFACSIAEINAMTARKAAHSEALKVHGSALASGVKA